MTWKLLFGALLALLAGSASAEPVSATLALVSMAGAAGAAGGLAAMSMATAFSTVASGLAFVGGAVSLVGNITGNKTLTKIGAVAGLAGLGTSLLSSAGEAASAGAQAAGAGAGPADAAGAGQLAETADSGALIDGAAASGQGAAAASPAAGVDPGLPAQGPSGMAAPGGAEAASVAQPGAEAMAPAAPQTSSGFGGAGTDPAAQGMPGAGGGLIDSMGKAVGKGVDWINANPGVSRIGAGLIQGAASAYGQQQAQAAEMSYYDRLRAKFSDSVIGMNPPGIIFNPNAVVTRTTPQNPIRYIPGGNQNRTGG